MELIYKGKKQQSDILKDAYSQDINIPFNVPLLIKGDNYLVLSGLLKQFRNKIDLIYIDPPFNTNQVFTVNENRQNSISRDDSGVIAYSDNLSSEHYLEFMRERLILAKELLSEKGSIFVHIDSKMGHYLKIIMDEIFGVANFKNDITRVKSNPKNFSRRAFGNEKDNILFYSKNYSKNIWNEIRTAIDQDTIEKRFPKIDSDGRRYTTIPLHAPGVTKNGITGQPWRGQYPPEGRHWRTNPAEFDILDAQGLIEWSSNGNPRIKKYADEHKGVKIQDIWRFKDPQNPKYPTEKNYEMLNLIVKQCSNTDSIVMDFFSGSGSTLLAAQNNNRKWIGIDQSEIAIEVTKTRLEGIKYIYIEI